MGGKHSVHLKPLSQDVLVQKNVSVPMRDGVNLKVNLFRPSAEGQYPVLMHCVPYGKDDTCHKILGGLIQVDDVQYIIMQNLLGGNLGEVNFSDATPWEAMDPDYWCQHGYVVIHADSRGYFASEGRGQGTALGNGHEKEDYYDLIEWAARQSWSTGKVGTLGVSYLAISQWYVASTRPPSLAAICPWEGFSDPYRHLAFVGGCTPIHFSNLWLPGVMAQAKGGPGVNITPLYQATIKNNNLASAEWKAMGAPVEQISVPALVCASWSDQGIHNPGTFEAFERLTCPKWLYTHGRSKWQVFYSEEDFQRRFFDHFLKGEENGWEENTPPVRIEVRDTYDQFLVRREDTWPLPRTEYTKLYLRPDATMSLEPYPHARQMSYEVRRHQLSFSYTFDQPTELTGYFKLRVWVACDGFDDMQIMVHTYKLAADGKRVEFAGVMGDTHEGVSKGFFRVSHRTSLVPERSTVYRPYYAHDVSEPLPASGEFVCVEVPMCPSSTMFHTGESLELTVSGHCQNDFSVLKRAPDFNHGVHRLGMGGEYDAYLLIPLIPGGPVGELKSANTYVPTSADRIATANLRKKSIFNETLLLGVGAGLVAVVAVYVLRTRS